MYLALKLYPRRCPARVSAGNYFYQMHLIPNWKLLPFNTKGSDPWGQDCDENGTLLFTTLNAEPEVNLSGLYLGCAYLELADLDFVDLSNTNGWGAATWTNATYNKATVFPDGMNPEKFGMINIGFAACYVSTGCVEISDTSCVALGGNFIPSGSCNECTPPEPTGACCVSTGYATNTNTDCNSFGGSFLGAGGTCNDCVAPPTSCDADLDGDGEVKIADLLLLIGAWEVCP